MKCGVQVGSLDFVVLGDKSTLLLQPFLGLGCIIASAGKGSEIFPISFSRGQRKKSSSKAKLPFREHRKAEEEATRSQKQSSSPAGFTTQSGRGSEPGYFFFYF
jgi:hypothetical protein